MSIPLVQNNDKDAINTSIIAIKRNIERINMLLGLSNSEEIDTSKFATKDELQQAVTDLQPVDEVTVDNMHSVTSNVVARMFNTNLNDDIEVDITSQVTCLLGVDYVSARRKDNLVKLRIRGSYTGSPSVNTQQLIKSMPDKYRPKQTFNSFAFLGYNSSQYVTLARGQVQSDGIITLAETSWVGGTRIETDIIYFVD